MDDTTIGFPHRGGNAASDEPSWCDAFGGVAAPERNDPVVAELRACRETKALTLAQVAERSGLPEEMLAQWEDGGGSPPLDALRRWATGLGMSLELVRSENPGSCGYSLDWECRRLSMDGKPVRLTRMEWNILERLAWSPGQLVTHRDLFRHLYGEERQDRAQATAIRVRISKLRQKVPFRIEARWGQGYVVEGVEAPPRHSAPSAGDVDEDLPAACTTRAERVVGTNGRNATYQASQVGFAVTLAERPRPAPPPLPLRIEQPVKRMRPPPLPTTTAVRAAELGVIERFLAERGATRCPDPRMLAQQAVPALVWDKIKRKWVRPIGEGCGAELAQ
jgi:transcriptional regulator with XRE-family HTH domain